MFGFKKIFHKIKEIWHEEMESIHHLYIVLALGGMLGITFSHSIKLIIAVIVIIFFIFFKSKKTVYAKLIKLDNNLELNISKHLIRIGRDSDCDIWLDNLSVSSFHATIKTKDGVFTLSDLNSSNGTKINGTRLNGNLEIVDGDIIDIAEVRLKFSVITNNKINSKK